MSAEPTVTEREAGKRVLPADVYDALELAALAFGGIGGGLWTADYNKPDYVVALEEGRAKPCCVHGAAILLDGRRGEVASALYLAGIDTPENDDAVKAINARNGVENRKARVSFTEWCAELGVERGA